MRLTGPSRLLLLSVVAVFAVLYLAPLMAVVRESFKIFQSGRIGGLPGTLTLGNYAVLANHTYIGYFADTFRISLIATAVGMAVSYVIAYFIARRRGLLQAAWIGLLVSMLFVGTLVRAYAFSLTFGPVGILLPLARFLGLSPNSVLLIELTVAVGLLHYVIPLMALILVGTIKNVNPSLEGAAMMLGASRWKAFLTITVPLSVRGILSVFLLGYALTISSFVIPLVLGKGIVQFVTNLIFVRFSELADYPGGAAIAMVLLVLSLSIIFGLIRVVHARFHLV